MSHYQLSMSGLLCRRIPTAIIVYAPHAVIFALAYGISFRLASVGTAVIIPQVFGGSYYFGVAQVGLVYIAALVGVFVGEQAAGPVSDVIIKRHVKACKTANTPVRLEYRL